MCIKLMSKLNLSVFVSQIHKIIEGIWNLMKNI